MLSLNKFIVEPISTDRSLRANNASGFALIEQRTALKALKTLADAHIAVGNESQFIESGSYLFIKEERMFEPGWPGKVYLNDEWIQGGVMIIDPNFVEFIVPSGDLPADMDVPF